MVAHYKLSSEDVKVYPINRDTVEEHLCGRWPWFQRDPARDDDQYFAVCPYCDNPIQLKSLYRRSANSPRPYGSHSGKAIDGFPHFNVADMQCCPYRLKQRVHKRDDRRGWGEVGNQLIDRAINEFDRIIYLLRQDFGFPFSNRFAEKMLDFWFSSKEYLYTGAHLRNLPWMIAYFGPTASIYGQYIGANAELVDAINEQVDGARVTGQGRLEQEGETRFNLSLQCLHHRFGEIAGGGALDEYMTLRVKDFSKSNIPDGAPDIYQQKINFDPDRFEALIHTPFERAERNDKLLEIAKTVADKWSFNNE